MRDDLRDVNGLCLRSNLSFFILCWLIGLESSL